MKNLVIVESPAKAKTIEKFLGKDYTVKASFGHIRDLAKKDLGIDIEHDFKPTYIVSDDKEKVVKELKKLVKDAETVYIATDEDREGEAIGWHLCEALGLDSAVVSRIVFHEITKTALDVAIKNPRRIDMHLVNAQQSRRVLDRLVGFQVSPILWKKVRMGLSAGRVQSVAVRLIVEREREILAFISEESWKIRSELVAHGVKFSALLTKVAGKGKKFDKRDTVESFLASYDISPASITEKTDKKGALTLTVSCPLDMIVVDAVKKDTKRSPYPPFTTSTLQQEASRKLGYSVGQTMTLAQSLYQNGHITYMRTDSVNLSSFIIDQAKAYIEKAFGKEYALPNGRHYKTKQANAQEAHEAIRPTSLHTHPDKLAVDSREQRLYRLIWERTLACQMADARLETTTYTFTPEGKATDVWTAKGEVVKFPGFMRLYTEGSDVDEEDGENEELPKLEKGESAQSLAFHAQQIFSKPPARYSEAMLVKKLESEGIGRPSTYVPTISTIVERGYIEKVEKRLVPTEIAFIVNDFLVAHFDEMMRYTFTASIEEELDIIASGKLDWIVMLHKFYDGFSTYVKEANDGAEKVVVPVGRPCPECGGDLVYKYSKSGKFIGCNKYPACKHIERVRDEKKEAELDRLREYYEGKPCPAGGTITVKTGRFGPFLSSSLYPEVKWIGKVLPEKYRVLEEELGGAVCDECGKGTMHVKTSRKWPFLACSAYPDCKNAKPLPKEKRVRKGKEEDTGEGE